jgi:hypothetical protein
MAPKKVSPGSVLPAVPDTISLGGFDIKTVFDKAMFEQSRKIGAANYPEQTITLSAAGHPMQTLEHTYLHEMVHWILFMMNRFDLRDDETFVDVFAHFLYQALKTAK